MIRDELMIGIAKYKAIVMPANAGIHVLLGRQQRRGYPEFTNEVQHQAKVLQWPEITPISILRIAVRLPAFMKAGNRCAKSRQLWIARQRHFCNPHSPWQKGGIENANGRLRRLLPRKADLRQCSRRQIYAIARSYNNTPRKCLGFKTLVELFSNHLLHFKCESTFPLSRE